MKVLEIILVIVIIKIGLCQSNERVCQIVKSSTKLMCDIQNDELMIRWDDYVRMIKNSEMIQFICRHSRSINFNGFPLVDLSDVRTMEVKGCSLTNQFTLNEIKNRFNLTHLVHMIVEAPVEKVSISSNLFQSYDNLLSLEFTTSKNYVLSENSFRELKSLQTLKLKTYDITTVPYNLFMPLSSLSKLDILSVADRLKEDEKKFSLTFSECRKLEYFTMSGIRWPVKLNLTFDRMLTEIQLSNNNRISEVSENLFGLTTQIEKIDLSNNRLAHLPLNLLWNQGDLEKINLSHNELTYIENAFFCNNSDLEEIDLSFNRIEFITENTLSNLNHLKSLHLNDNKFDRFIVKNLLNGLSSLEFLSLQNNKISVVIGELPSLNNLIQIDLSRNHLNHIYVYKFMSQSPHLTLKLMDNRLENIDFHNICKNMVSFDRRLAIDLGTTPMNCNCRTLNLYEFLHQKLPLDEMIYENVKIIPEDVKCNKSTHTVMMIEPEKHLCELDTMPHQTLCAKECHCVRNPIDRTLNVECMNISQFPSLPPRDILATNDVDKIKLKVNTNVIERLPSKFDHNYNAVIEIYAQFNHIKHLSENNFPDDLEILDLRLNRLQYVGPKVLQKFAKLKSLFLGDNPWNCSSPLAKDLINFVKTHREIVKDFNTIRCTDNVYFLEFKANDCHFYIYITLVVSLLILTFVGIFVLYYRNRTTIVDFVYQKDHHHIMERSIQFLKKLDACIVCAEYDKVFANYVGTKLIKSPNSFKCALIEKNWQSDEKIPKKIAKAFRASRRIIVILSEYFEEDDWAKWKFSAISSSIIFITKGTTTADVIKLPNMMTMVRFNDPWFWDKLKFAMTNHEELIIDSNDVEMQPLRAELI